VTLSGADALWQAGAGAAVGLIAALLSWLGNPVDGGISVACFLRDCAGAFGLHQIIEFSSLRPELPALVVGATAAALATKGFAAREGSSPLLRFCIGIILSIGMFAFIGCPLRVALRLGGGDPAALWAAGGLICGVWLGTQLLTMGFTLGKPSPAPPLTGFSLHSAALIVLVLLFVKPSTLTFSTTRHAPLLLSLVAGTLIGVLAQRSKLCFIGGMRNFFLMGDTTGLVGFGAVVVSTLLTNVLLGQGHFGTTLVGSSDALWSFLALLSVGLGSVMIDGCPFRQLILAAQGNADSTLALIGMMVGAALSYNIYSAHIGDSLETIGKVSVLGGIFLLGLIGLFNLKR
jgi:YedE family putative selenium metabolism protein